MNELKTMTPRELSDKLMRLSSEYALYAGGLAACLKIQADYFNKNRENYKSDNATQKAFDSTEEGVDLNILKLKLKVIEKEMSAIKTHLRLLENEAKNIY